ncbi:hypothetical protein [Haloarcula onubensis]|uniref:Uncharacterized protein n=1 Tax=Haloarcula onubensis TaxID=2950539 RepID=A0ABU2FX48_9EURY|nr:hypothetical protein [Halomicroarcula sp. S3CR25-11]MDS0284721.1 hypothetical protein [Halomicroarcula sp. S3CR25-11]
MNLRKRAKAVAGLLAVIVLLGLIAADTMDASITLTLEDKILLLSLIASLLGLDKLADAFPVPGVTQSPEERDDSE